MKKLNLKGQRFGAFVVLEQASHVGNRIRWLCLCDCGHKALVMTDNLRSGNSTNCGCGRKAMLRERNTTHDMSTHPLYKTWLNIRNRCTNPNHQDYYLYGAKGIKVDLRWDSFPNFVMDMGEKPGPEYSIDRINPYGNYELGNCRWATPVEQRNNQRPGGILDTLILED